MTINYIDVMRKALEALEALEQSARACSNCQTGPEDAHCCRIDQWNAATELRAAIAQLEHGVELPEPAGKVCEDGYWLSNARGPLRPLPQNFANCDFFTKDQMLAYGQACRAAGLAPMTEADIDALFATDIPKEDICAWSVRQGIEASERHHGIGGKP